MTAARALRRTTTPAPRSAAVVENLEPLVEAGRFSARAVEGEPLVVRADVYSHGHELVRAIARLRRVGTKRWSTSVMEPLGNDRFEGRVVAREPGKYELEVLGEPDALATWRRDVSRRLEAGRFDPNDPVLGATLLRDAARLLVANETTSAPEGTADDLSAGTDKPASSLRKLAARLRNASDGATLEQLLAELGDFDAVLSSRRLYGAEPARAAAPLRVQRELAACSSWYECFPRSTSPDPSRPGTLLDLVGRLDYVAGLGFDVLYLPPIHPIGSTGRKGKDNSSTARAGDVGSPWAIGSAAGGHDAVAPELGTLDDVDLLVAEASRRQLEVALDLAFQCSPDHPWVTAHPEWFAWRPDGTIACAENPPKRYEDVVPLNFATDDRYGLYQALLEVVLFWVERGIRVFGVDNPHTKPFELWEWLLGAVHEIDPGVVFLSEAFTRPAVMHHLAKLGFDQSYTYFTWRDTKGELVSYLDELATGPGRAYFRGNLWPNTPDILPSSLKTGGRASFVTRLVLAACGSANYGIYGPVFELLVDEPVRAGSEEYRHSEKYEVQHWNLADETSIAELVRRVNGARKLHPALRHDASLKFHHVDNDAIICWSKRDERSGDTVVCVVNLDPHWAQSGFVELDCSSLGIAEGSPFLVRDLLEDATYTWRASRNFVLLDPHRTNAHVLFIEPGPATGLRPTEPRR